MFAHFLGLFQPTHPFTLYLWTLPRKFIMLVCFSMCLLIWKKTIGEKESKEGEGAMITAMEGISR